MPEVDPLYPHPTRLPYPFPDMRIYFDSVLLPDVPPLYTEKVSNHPQSLTWNLLPADGR